MDHQQPLLLTLLGGDNDAAHFILKPSAMDVNAMPGSTRAGTAGGTVLVVVLHLSSGELLKTAALAAVGAAVSFAVSYLLKRLVRKIDKRKIETK